MNTIFEDQNIEESKIKSCLLFNNRVVKDKSNKLLQKYILSIIISGEADTTDGINRYLERNGKGHLVVSQKVDSCIAELLSNEFIEIDNDKYIMTEKTRKDSENYYSEITSKFEILIDEILIKIKQGYKKPFSNDNQVRANVKNCLNYYYAVSGISFFDLDDKKDIADLSKLDEIASYHLNKEERNKLKEIIIYTIGSIIEKPSDTQKDTLEKLARIYVSSQVMNIDPVLRSFKTVIIKDKVFILDTEVLLFAITENASLSKQCRLMIKQLTDCGCKVYIPKEIIKEVFDHAEAAKKRFSYESYLMDMKSSIVRPQLKNIFIEDYYIIHNSNNKGLSWDKYLSNYYNSNYGVVYTEQQIKAKLGNKIFYSQIPKIDIPEEERWELEGEALKMTEQTEKAQYREDNKNDQISKNDTLLYLTAKYLNKQDIAREGIKDNRPDLMMYKYYILSLLTRIHKCALKLGIESNVLCKPSALLAYLAETGIMTEKIEIQSLFDNPFLMHTANVVWPDVEKLLRTGVDVRDKNLVNLRFELQHEINTYLSNPTSENINEFVKIATDKGVRFDEQLQVILDEKKYVENELAQKQKELESSQHYMSGKIKEMESQMSLMSKKIEEKDSEIERMNKTIRKQKYELRMAGTNKNRKTNRKKK